MEEVLISSNRFNSGIPIFAANSGDVLIQFLFLFQPTIKLLFITIFKKRRHVSFGIENHQNIREDADKDKAIYYSACHGPL